MQKGLQNRSLDRGISIMEALATHGSCSLADLHRHCGLPKSTIRRLLGTLMERRIVRRSVADQLYRINITLPSSTGKPVPPKLARLVDTAMPMVIELTEQVGWPSDLHVLDGERMIVADSTRPLSPFHLYRGKINSPINIFGSATGMACLMLWSDARIGALAKATHNDMTWGLARFKMDLEGYWYILGEARKRGYAARFTDYVGGTIFDDKLAAIAVAIVIDGKPEAALNLLWPREFQSHEKTARQHLAALQATATAIGQAMDGTSPTVLA